MDSQFLREMQIVQQRANEAAEELRCYQRAEGIFDSLVGCLKASNFQKMDMNLRAAVGLNEKVQALVMGLAERGGFELSISDGIYSFGLAHPRQTDVPEPSLKDLIINKIPSTKPRQTDDLTDEQRKHLEEMGFDISRGRRLR